MNPKPHHWGWHLALFTSLIVAALFLFYAGKKLDYEWHWSRIPGFFITFSKDTVTAPTEGQIVAIHDHAITLKTLNGQEENITLPNTTEVHEGQEVFEGDMLAEQESWHFGPLSKGLWVTLWMSLLAGVFGFALSIVVALMRLSRNPLWHGLATTYIEVIRGTPLLVQLLIAYFFIGTLFQLDRHIAGLGALSLFVAAYFAEILRSGMLSIPYGQLEAASALGMTHLQTVRYLSLPMGIKRSLPALTGQMINLVKDSSLLSVIAVSDLTKVGREVASSTFASFEVWFTVALLYLAITFSLAKLSHQLEKR